MNGDLLQQLRAATAPMHEALEAHAVMQRILGGAVTRSAYCLYLRNLHPIYATLEETLEHCSDDPALAAFNRPALFRGAAIARDLCTLSGADWHSLALMPSAVAYAGSLQRLAREQPALLGAHAYVRYLGDLSGGRIVRGRIAAALALDAADDASAGLEFYAFDAPPRELARQLRSDLGALPLHGHEDAFVKEAVSGFARHRALFDELELDVGYSPPLN